MSPRHRGRRHGHGPGANGAGPEGASANESTIAGGTALGDPAAGGPVAESQLRTAQGPRPQRAATAAARQAAATRPAPAAPDVAVAEVEEEICETKPACTLAQMRRFIKSRPYVPVHELRRRFEISGIEDEVSPLPTEKGTCFVGLPSTEAGYLAELIKTGDVGYELLLDPASPAVVGVFPMRPVARQ